MLGHLSHSIIQYVPNPTHGERANIGVMVLNMETRDLVARYLQNFNEPGSGDDANFLRMALRDYMRRCDHELRSGGAAFSASAFNARRIGLFTLTDMMPVRGNDVHDAADTLFQRIFSNMSSKVFDARETA